MFFDVQWTGWQVLGFLVDLHVVIYLPSKQNIIFSISSTAGNSSFPIKTHFQFLTKHLFRALDEKYE